MSHQKITVLIPAFNCANYYTKTLESVKWADEILLIDSYSTDNTIEIAKSYGARVIQHEYLNSSKQKNWAIPFSSHQWIFQIDTDEVLEPGAEKIIRDAIDNASMVVDCFRMARRNHVLGKWIKYGGIYPDWEHRLFRKEKGLWFDREVHSNIRVEGKIETLTTDLLHFGMPNISKQIKNLDRYTRYEADELKNKNRKFSYVKWLLFPHLVFCYRYFYMKGFLDGWRGYLLAINSAYYYFLSQSKLKELEELNLDKSPY